MASFNSLKTLYLALKNSPILAGDPLDGYVPVNVQFGAKHLYIEGNFPKLVIIPIGGPIKDIGVANNVDPQQRMVAKVIEDIELHLYDVSLLAAPETVDNIDQVEQLRARVIQAMQYQRWNSSTAGLMFHPISERWILRDGNESVYGYGLILRVTCEITVPDTSITEATILHINQTQGIPTQ